MSVLGLLVVALRARGMISESDAQAVFGQAPRRGSAGRGGGRLVLCLGTPVGEYCRALPDGSTGWFGTAVPDVPPADVDRLYRPGGASAASTGWVAVDPARGALPVLLRLVGRLAAKGRLRRDEAYRVFDDSLAVTVGLGSGGRGASVRLGWPIGTVTDAGARAGDVMLNLTDAELVRDYGRDEGWGELPAGEISLYHSLLSLVVTLTYNGLLTGAEAYGLFG
jgi:hypothetical protein